MKARGRVKPSKLASAGGLIVGLIFVWSGLTFGVLANGGSSVLWLLIGLAITGYHAVNLFSEHGMAHEVLDLDISTEPGSHTSGSESPEQRLFRLGDLRRKGLVSEREYEEQRKRILDEI